MEGCVAQWREGWREVWIGVDRRIGIDMERGIERERCGYGI